MADEFIIKLISDDFAEGVGGGGRGGGTTVAKGGAFALGAKLGLGIGLATEALALISDTIGNILRPAKNILKGIFRIVGELLRPISDVLILILRPILIIVRPLLQLFKAFMAPFISIAREFGRIAIQQARAGNIGIALEASMEGIKTLLGPFVVSIVSIALQLATSLIVANITNLINLIVVSIGALFQPIFDFLGLGDQFKERIQSITAFVSAQGALLSTNLNEAITDGTVNILGEMEDSLQKNLNLFKNKTSLVEGLIGTSTGIMTTDMENTFGTTGSIPAAYADGLNAMTTETDSFVGRLQEAADKINAISIRGISGGGRSLISRGISAAGRFIGSAGESIRSITGDVGRGVL